MSVVEISTIAGDILSALERSRGSASLEQLTSSRRCSRDLVIMALGWLFKEGLIIIQPGIGDWFVKTRPQLDPTLRKHPHPYLHVEQIVE